MEKLNIEQVIADLAEVNWLEKGAEEEKEKALDLIKAIALDESEEGIEFAEKLYKMVVKFAKKEADEDEKKPEDKEPEVKEPEPKEDTEEKDLELDEAKKVTAKEDIEIAGTNLLIHGIGMDVNGNKVVYVKTPNEKATAIQTNGKLSEVHKADSPEDVNEDGKKEIVDYVKKYASGKLKDHFKEYTKEEIDEAKKWSGDVETNWKAPEGLFTKSAEEISKEVLSGHKGDKGSAIKAIEFYKNRAGSNLSDERKKVLDSAVKKLQEGPEEKIDETYSTGRLKKFSEIVSEAEEDMIVLVDGNKGIYVPMEFVSKNSMIDWGFDEKDPDVEIVKAGPDAVSGDESLYWDSWDKILDKAKFEKNGKVYKLYQDQDLFAKSENFNPEEETVAEEKKPEVKDEKETITESVSDKASKILDETVGAYTLYKKDIELSESVAMKASKIFDPEYVAKSISSDNVSSAMAILG